MTATLLERVMVRECRHLALILCLGAVWMGGCQERVVRTNNSYAANAHRPTAEQQAQRNRQSHMKFRSHSRHQAAKQSGNPLDFLGAMLEDLGDMLMPPTTPKGLSSTQSRPSTSFGGAIAK